MAQRKHPAGGWLHRPQAISHRAVARPSHGRCFGTSWHGSWESYAFLAVQLHYDIAQGLENLMPETQHLETSDCWRSADSVKHAKHFHRESGKTSELHLALGDLCNHPKTFDLRCRLLGGCINASMRALWNWEFSGLNLIVLLSHHFLPKSRESEADLQSPIYWSPVSVYRIRTGPNEGENCLCFFDHVFESPLLSMRFLLAFAGHHDAPRFWWRFH